MTAASKPPTDLELMLYADGELGADESRAVEAFLVDHPDARRKVDSLDQMGEMLRTYAELETDEAERAVPAFAGLWDRVEGRIHANGSGRTAGAEVEAAAIKAKPTTLGVWASLRRWLGEHRGHMVTGLVGAGAACALMLALGPRQTIVQQRTVQVAGETPASSMPVVLQSEPPEIEDLEVYDGSGTILTMEAEGDDETSAAVIWISNDDEENMEDPI